MKNRLLSFLIYLLVFVLITLFARGLNYFSTIDEQKIRWFLALVLVSGFIAIASKKRTVDYLPKSVSFSFGGHIIKMRPNPSILALENLSLASTRSRLSPISPFSPKL